MLTTKELFDINRMDEALRGLLEPTLPWEVLAALDSFLAGIVDERAGKVHPTAVIEGPLYLAPGATVGPHAYIEGPVYLGANAKVGHGAYLRGGVVLASRAVVGHSSEVKHALFLPDAKAPHFNYVGDSIIGRNVNLGAGVKLANFHAFGQVIKVSGQATGLRKFGAAIGDEVSIGCNAVLAPGTIVGPRTVVYHGAMLRGVYEADRVVKLRGHYDEASRDAVSRDAAPRNETSRDEAPRDEASRHERASS